LHFPFVDYTFHGLYKKDGDNLVPIEDGTPFLSFSGPSFHSNVVEINTEPLAVLFFHLPSAVVQCSAPSAVHTSLNPFFTPNQLFGLDVDLGIHDDSRSDDDMVVDEAASSSRVNSHDLRLSFKPVLQAPDPNFYMFADIPFWLDTDRDLDAHHRKLDVLIEKLEKYVFLCSIFCCLP